MSTAEQSLRRRALYTGLRPHLRDSEIMEAMLLWEANYANHSKFSVRYFVGELSKHLNREKDEKALLLSLVSTLALPDRDLLPDPADVLREYRKSRTPRSYRFPRSTPEIEATKLLLTKWLSLTDPSSATHIESMMVSGINQLRVDPQFATEFKRWIHNRKQNINGSLVSLGDLRQAINLTYTAFCEVIGPVDTDRLLSEAVTRLRSNGGAQYAEIFNKLL